MNKNKINEVSFALHKIAAQYISGKTNNLDQGFTIKQEKFCELVKECKYLKEALENKNLKKIEKHLKRKNELAENFYNLTCIKWML